MMHAHRGTNALDIGYSPSNGRFIISQQLQSFSSYALVKPFAMITGSVFFSPMNTSNYRAKVSILNLRACKIDDNNFLCESTKSIKTLLGGMVCKVCKANADSFMF